jgi:hypothetical protein
MRTIPGRFLRLARAHATSVLVVASIAWVAASLILAVEHGGRRRTTFNGAEPKCSQEPCKVHVPLAVNP